MLLYMKIYNIVIEAEKHALRGINWYHSVSDAVAKVLFKPMSLTKLDSVSVCVCVYVCACMRALV